MAGFCFVLLVFIERTRGTGEGEGLLSLSLVRARVLEISPLVSYYIRVTSERLAYHH